MKDRRAIARAIRRLRSTRAAAFLEFCMIAPILVMFCSGILEFVQLWDAKIMANHAAWTVGRIASVQAGLTDSATSLSVTPGMKFATAALMSTATMGIGGNAVKASSGWLTGPLQSDIGRLTSGLQLSGADGQMSAAAKDIPDDFLVSIFGKKVGEALSRLLSSSVATLVNDCIKDVKENLWPPILNKWHPAVTMSGILGRCQTHGVENGDRQLRQMGVAQQLVNRTVGGRPVLSVTEGQTSPFVLSKSHSLSGNTSPDFPRCLDTGSHFDTWRITQDSSWPPEGAAQRMILVSVSWPFERAWLYPIFSREKWSGKDPVAAGESIAYPQPKIRNANLQSDKAEAYKRDPVPAIPKEFGDLREHYVNFLKTAAFAITYRLGHEFIGAHDAGDWVDKSHKGLGLMPVKPSQREKIERRFGNHRSPWIWDVSEGDDPKDKNSMARDGLCYWMDRAKLPERKKSDPYGLDLSSDDVDRAWEVRNGHYADYLMGWRSVAVFPSYKDSYDKDIWDGSSEAWRYYSAGRTYIFLNINNYEKVHANEWFHWGKETGSEITFVDKKGNKSTGPSEREKHLHLRHRKSESLNAVLARVYEEPCLDSGYRHPTDLLRFRNLKVNFILDSDFRDCERSSTDFFHWLDPAVSGGPIAKHFNSHDEYCEYVQKKARKDPRYFPTIRHVVDSLLTNDQKWRFRREEDEFKRLTRETVAQFDKMIRLLEDEQNELERTVFGGAMPTPGSGDDIWSFGIDERDVQKDPKKALQNMDAAIKKKKAESMDILYDISARIERLRNHRVHGCLRHHLTRWPVDGLNGGMGPRKPILNDWVGNLINAWKGNHDLDWGAHTSIIRGGFKDKGKLDGFFRDLTNSARDMKNAMKEYYGEVQGLYQRELDYGLRLGLSAAKEAKRRDQKKKIEPVKPGDWPPRPAPPPSRGPGSDDDYLGDGWRLEGSGEKRGWKSMTDGGWKP